MPDVLQHNIDYMCSADPMQFNVGPASATSDQYYHDYISIGSTHRGCWVDLKPCAGFTTVPEMPAARPDKF